MGFYLMERKTALVTGASRGIGRSIALALAENGYDIGVNYHSSKEKALEVCSAIEAKGAKTICLQGDISNMQDINSIFDAFFEEFGHIDLLVNNAGITRFSPFLEVTEEFWNNVVNTDWKGAFFSAQRAAKNMVETNTKGVIINISSNQQDGCWPIASVYGPTKAALNKFTKHAAMELARYGIRMLAIAPGYTTSSEHNTSPNRISNCIPMQRFASYEEIAEAVVFLASDKAGYITGTCLSIDGGALLPVVVENSFV